MDRATRTPTAADREVLARRFKITREVDFVDGWHPQPGWDPRSGSFDPRLDRVDCLRWVKDELEGATPIPAWPRGGVERLEFLDAQLVGWRRQSTAPPTGDVIAVFVDPHGVPSHVARRRKDGRWESKLGIWPAIVHDGLKVLRDLYGDVEQYYVRTT